MSDSQPPAPTVWIVGQFIETAPCGVRTIWDFQGAFSTEEKAVAACKGPNYWVGPIALDQELPEELQGWPGSYWPHQGAGQVQA